MKSIYLFNRLFTTPKNNIFIVLILGFIISFSTSTNAQNNWNDPGAMIIQDGATPWNQSSLREVVGRPGIAFCDESTYKVKFQRGTDSKGTGWGSAIIVDNTDFSGLHKIDMEIINGNPAVANSAHGLYDIRYTRAANSTGDFWASTVQVVTGISTSNHVNQIDLEEVNGKPAIAYYHTDDKDLYYVQANDATGSTWGTPVLVASTGDVGDFLSMSVIDGKPAIAYYDGTNEDLKYVRATDADGSTWGTPVTPWSNGNVGQHASLTTVNGRPAIVFEEVDNSRLLYMRASDVTGATWPGFPAIITSHRGEEMDLLVVDGKPAVAYYTGFGAQDLRYLYSQDVDGTNWNAPILLDDGSTAMGNILSMAIIDGNPAISYQDYTNSDLKYIRATYVHGLPVELTFFKGEMTKEGTKLTWQTATEEINEGFEVQRSIDGKEWEVLDFVFGNGTTIEVQNYDYLDENPLEGTTYYRLKQIDFDGQFEFSDIIEITQNENINDEITIYPTLVKDNLNIEGGSGKILIYNNVGQPIKVIEIYNDQTTLNLRSLPNGQYFLRLITSNNNSVKTFTFVKIE
ncbi:MAG: T9SS type A sorting domain-containing protein [Saprospiraceae bacterium]